MNARDLFFDAKLLLENRRYARAFSLCVLSLEELAKIPILANGVHLKKDDKERWKSFWASLRKHEVKQGVWQYYGRLLLSKTERAKYYESKFPKDFPLDKLKQRGFYVDFIGKEPMIPNILFLHCKTVRDAAFKIAEDRLRAFYPLHSKIEYSEELVKFASKTKIDGMSKEEFIDIILKRVKQKSNTFAGKDIVITLRPPKMKSACLKKKTTS